MVYVGLAHHIGTGEQGRLARHERGRRTRAGARWAAEALAGRRDRTCRAHRDVVHSDAGNRDVPGVGDRERVGHALTRRSNQGRVRRLGDGDRRRLRRRDRDGVGGAAHRAGRRGSLRRGVVDDRTVVEVDLGHDVGPGERRDLARSERGRRPRACARRRAQRLAGRAGGQATRRRGRDVGDTDARQVTLPGVPYRERVGDGLARCRDRVSGWPTS